MAPKKKRKTIDNKSLSRRPVVCGECNKTLERYESLNPRFDIVHHGKAPCEKGQTKLNLGAPTGKQPFRSNEAEDTSNSDTSANGHPTIHCRYHHQCPRLLYQFKVRLLIQKQTMK